MAPVTLSEAVEKGGKNDYRCELKKKKQKNTNTLTCN